MPVAHPLVSIAAGAGAGVGAVATLTSTDGSGYKGQGTVKAAGTPAAGVIATVTLGAAIQPMAEAPIVELVPVTALPTGLVVAAQLVLGATGYTGFNIVCTGALVAGTTYTFSWAVKG